MIFTGINLENYRNVSFDKVSFKGRDQFLVGRNGQGKTNLLEALSLITSLRSFRTNKQKNLIGSEKDYSGIYYHIVHERLGELNVELKIKSKGKEIFVNGEAVKRQSEIIGDFPVVVFSSLDFELIRGTPSGRRGYVDQFVCSLNGQYFDALRRYHQALDQRNILLKSNGSIPEMEAFEQIMAVNALFIISQRRQMIHELGAILSETYQRMSESEEVPRLIFQPNLEAENVEEILGCLSNGRERDRIMKATSRGPHKDEYLFMLNGRLAKEIASEGQQRSLVSALKLGQIEIMKQKTNVSPVILADDVVNELDSGRRELFWHHLNQNYQIIATGTDRPAKTPLDWNYFSVEKGRFHQL